MEPKCSVCTNQYRKDVDISLASGTSVRKVAVQFGISVTAIQRHKLKHLITKAKAVKTQQAVHRTKEAVRDEERHQEQVETTWATRLETMYAAAAHGVEKAAADPDKWYMGASFIGQGIKACDVGMRATGEISSGTTTINANVLVMPQPGVTLPAPGIVAPARNALPAGDVIDAEPCDE